MMRSLERLLDLRPGERGRAALLFLFLFLVISTYVGGKAARDALFLEHFPAVRLPWVDLGIGLLSGVVVAVHIRGRQRMNLAALLIGSLLFFASNAVALWWLSRRAPSSWLPAAVYVWVGLLGVIAPAQVWMLANHVLTLREAKRLFGLIGSGAILGWIVGGLLTSATATRFGADASLLAIAAALVACAGLVAAIWRRRPTDLAALDQEEANLAPPPRTLLDSFRLVRGARYLRAIAVVIGLSSLVTGIAAWQFKAIAKAHIPDTNQLAAFFGQFNFWAGVLALTAQLALTSRLLRRFGVGLGLFIVPVALALGSVGLLVFGSLVAVVVLKGSDQVLRYSIDKSTVELLYLPVPSAQRFHAKLFIDSIVWRAGDGMASLAVLAAVGLAGAGTLGITWLNLALVATWMAGAAVAHRQYVANLSETVHQHRLDAERTTAPVLERSMQELITSKLASSDPGEVLYGMGLFDVSKRRAAHHAIRALLHHPSPEVRARAVAVLAEARDTSVRNIVERLLADADVRVRTEALLYLAHLDHIDPLARIEQLGDFRDFSIRSAVVAFLARPGATQNLDAASMLLDGMVAEHSPEGTRTRLEAARLIATIPGPFDRQLGLLLEDADPGVVREALHAVGRFCRRGFIERVIERLADPAMADEAAQVLAQCGDRVVGTLRDHLVDHEADTGLRRRIPAILLRIGTPAAQAALVENLICGDTVLRFRVISALNKLADAHPEAELDGQIIETALVAEIMGHYRSYEILGALGAPATADAPVTRGLRESMAHELERIFRLLQLRFRGHDIHSAYLGVQSANPVVHDNAIELLDHILRPQLRSLLVPLIDSDVAPPERTALAIRILGTEPGSREEAVASLIYSEDPWLKACAAYSIGALGLRTLAHELDRWVDDPDPLLRETARHSRAQLSA